MKRNCLYHVLFALLMTLALCLAAPAGFAQPNPADANWDDRFGAQGVSDFVSAIAVIGSNVYVGGDFSAASGLGTNVGSISANKIARWNGRSWAALGQGVNNSVAALAVIATNLYVGGTFTNAGGVAASRIAKWDGNGWSSLGTGLNGAVTALAVNGSDLYVGGDFTTAGGVPANHIAKWDGSTWSAVGSNLLTSVNVGCLAAAGGNLFVGGSISLLK
ncbi:MAG: hypothetical protein DME26_12135 [Verrucomicrobia bacterium]|nr:MAG: hypothetical protein DME26_12135 [Verrucomicrobiota bacterium]